MLLQTLTDAGVTTPFRLHGIPQEFLGHAKRAAILERIGLTPQALARGIVEDLVLLPEEGRRRAVSGRRSMSTTPAERSPARILAAVLVLASSSLLAARPARTRRPASDESTPRHQRQRHGGAAGPRAARSRATLDQRAPRCSPATGRRFLTGLEHGDPGFVTEQGGYFDNLRQLPLPRFAYDLDRRSLVRAGDDYWVVVEVDLQLEGFDAAAGRHPRPLPVRPDDEDGRYVVSSVTDPEWEARNEVAAAAVGHGRSRSGPGAGVLGIFDAGVGRARPSR